MKGKKKLEDQLDTFQQKQWQNE